MRTLKQIHKPISYEPRTIGVRHVKDGLIEEYGVNMNPDYQRGLVWTYEQKSAYVGYILNGGTTLPIIINAIDWGTQYSEMVDGKQRVTALCDWLDGIIEASLYDGSTVSYAELKQDTLSYRMLGLGVNIVVGFVRMSRREVLEYYLRLNSGGTAHSKDEIDRVRTMLKNENEAA